MNILEVSHVEKHYKRFQLRDVDMAMPQGCIMGLIGENGAGKSTLLKCILGLVRRDGGNITFRGEELNADTAQMEEIGVARTGRQAPQGAVQKLGQCQILTKHQTLRTAGKGEDQGIFQGHAHEARHCGSTVAQCPPAAAR